MTLEIKAGAFDGEPVVVFPATGMFKILIDDLGIAAKAERAAQPKGKGVGGGFAPSAGVSADSRRIESASCCGDGAFFGQDVQDVVRGLRLRGLLSKAESPYR